MANGRRRTPALNGPAAGVNEVQKGTRTTFNQYLRIGSHTSVTKDVTAGFFTGGVANLAGSNFTTKSLSGRANKASGTSFAKGQKNYYYNIQYSSEDQFSVAYGHTGGSGSRGSNGSLSITGGYKLKGETQAIYRQFASICLDEDDALDGFKFVSGSNTVQPDIYVMVAERARMKDKLDKANWTLHLSGSPTQVNESGNAQSPSYSRNVDLKLTDDSKYVAAKTSPLGPRYNIVSGSGGAISASSGTESDRWKYDRYGFFFPEAGVIVLSANKLSASIPGGRGYVTGSRNGLTDGLGNTAASGGGNVAAGLAPDLALHPDADNALKFAKSLMLGTDTSFRNVETQIITSHFCHIPAGEFNGSINPTFTSGSDGDYRFPTEMLGDPQVFITTIGLYDEADNLVAVGRLSSPIKKSFEDEAIIKVNITY
jgi:hypothetical protein